MKKLISLTLALIMMFALFPAVIISAEEETEKPTVFEYDKGSATLTISYINPEDIDVLTTEGGYKFIKMSTSPWSNYEKSIKKIVLTDGVEEIPAGTFAYLSSLAEVQLSETVKTIGAYAFYDCKKLEKINLTDFIEVIGFEAFRGCKSLKEFYIGKNVSKIYNNNFFNCVSLEKIKVADDNASYCDVDGVLYNKAKTELIAVPAKKADVKILSTTKKIADLAFMDNATKSISVPKSVETLGAGAFYKAKAEKISFSKYVTIKRIKTYEATFGDEAGEYYGTFEKCYYLKELKVPETVTTVDAMSFTSCKKLETVRFGAKVKYVDSDNFFGCKSLKKIVVNKDNKKLFVYGGALYAKKTVDKKTKIELIAVPRNKTSVKIKSGTTDIESFAFMNSKIKKVSIPKSVKYIDGGAFYNCRSLKEVDFSENGNLVKIGGYTVHYYGYLGKPDFASYGTFQNCVKLKKLVFPDTLKYFDAEGVIGCKNLKTLHLGKKFKGFVYNTDDVVISGIDAKGNYVDGVIGWGLDTYGTALSKITVSSKNKNYSAKDGVVYNKDKTSLLCYPPKKSGASFTVAKSVKVIGVGAFLNCKKLKKIKLQKSVKQIGYEGIGYYRSATKWHIKNKNVTIICAKNSKAYKYAKSEGIKYKIA